MPDGNDVTKKKFMSDEELTRRLIDTDMVKNYKKVMMDGLSCSFPTIRRNDLSEAIDWAILQSHRNPKLKLNNNYTHVCMDGTVLDILRYIEARKPIISASGVLFMRHEEKDNPLTRMIMGFIKQRKIYKNEMFKYPKKSYEYEKYNLLQLLEKIIGPISW